MKAPSTHQSLEPVSINDTRIRPKNAMHRKKLEALHVYVSSLLASPVRPQIAKIILYYINQKRLKKKRLSFIGIGNSGRKDIAENHEELLWKKLLK